VIIISVLILQGVLEKLLLLLSLEGKQSGSHDMITSALHAATSSQIMALILGVIVLQGLLLLGNSSSPCLKDIYPSVLSLLESKRRKKLKR
jgi:hypothetical protein